MDRKKLLKHLVYLIFLIFLVNAIATKFHLYYSVWYFDIPMHFLGGFWLTLAFIWFFSVEKLSFWPVFRIILGILFVGILWEMYEFYVNESIARNPFSILDTTSDILFDLAGGLSAMLYFLKRIMPRGEDKVQLD